MVYDLWIEHMINWWPTCHLLEGWLLSISPFIFFLLSRNCLPNPISNLSAKQFFLWHTMAFIVSVFCGFACFCWCSISASIDSAHCLIYAAGWWLICASDFLVCSAKHCQQKQSYEKFIQQPQKLQVSSFISFPCFWKVFLEKNKLTKEHAWETEKQHHYTLRKA